MTPHNIIPTPSRIIDGDQPATEPVGRPHPFFPILSVLAAIGIGTAVGAVVVRAAQWVASWLM